MTQDILWEPMVLSIYFNSRGFGYALFEGVNNPVDWGIKSVRTANIEEGIKKAKILIHMLHPSVLVLQDCKAKVSRCSDRVKRQVHGIATAAKKQGLEVFRYSREDVRRFFAPYGGTKKDDIARVIAQLMPEFAREVPPRRKVWMNEDYRMTLFDALALVSTYYSTGSDGVSR